MKKRIFVAILALLMVLPMAVACRKEKTPAPTPTPIDQDTTGYKSLMKKEDFNSADVNILIMPDRKSWSFVDGEPEDIFESAIYRRNAYVEDFYNINLKFEVGEQSSSYFSNKCQQSLYSDVADYDIISPDYYYGIADNGYFIDLAAQEEIHLENPYWANGWNENTTINGKNFAAVGYFTLDPVAKIEALYSNDAMLNAMGIGTTYDSLYKTVRDGNWTLELMKTYIKNASLNTGDAQWTFEDTYGLCANLWSGRAFLTAAGYQLSKFSDDKVTFTLQTERNIEIFDAIYNLFNDGASSAAGVYYCGGVANSAGYKPETERDTDLFKAERALFLAHSFSEIKVLGTDFTQEFSVFPMPKCDSKQENYISTILGSTIFGIMRNAKDKHMSCVILEALNIVSYEDVLPTYYDKLLRGRYTKNDDVAEMMDLIRNSLFVDFLFINSSAFEVSGLEGVANCSFDMIAKKDNTFSSTISKYEDPLKTLLRKFMEYYE